MNLKVWFFKWLEHDLGRELDSDDVLRYFRANCDDDSTMTTMIIFGLQKEGQILEKWDAHTLIRDFEQWKLSQTAQPFK